VRTAELEAPRKFRLVEHATPEPGPGEVLVRIHAVGICGSDLHYYAEGGIGGVAFEYPMVLGHEPTGTVVKTGPGVTGWSPGDRAALEPAVYCYNCEFCRNGRHNVCANIRFYSMPPDPGFFREYASLPVANLLPLPRELSFSEGTLFEPFAVVLHSMKFAAVAPGETAAVFGAGPIGLLTVIALKMCGAGRVWSVEPVPGRREIARVIGADAVLDPEDAVRQIRADTRGRGVDLAIDCAAQGGSMNSCIRVVRNAGRVVITGIPPDERVSLDFHEARRKEVPLLNVRRSNGESETALEILREQRKRFAPVLTHEFPLEEIHRGFDLLAPYTGGAAKVVIRCCD